MAVFDSVVFDSVVFDAAGLATPVAGVDVPDHVALALGRLCEQFKGKPNIASLLTALVTPTQALESCLWQLLTLRRPLTASGAQLDLIGKLVGQARNGSSDSDYARFISARIATNNSKGRVEDLIAITKLVLNIATIVIIVTRDGAATARVTTLNIAITDTVAAIVASFLQTAVAAGVRVVYQWSNVVPASTFTLDIGPGLDVGNLSSALG